MSMEEELNLILSIDSRDDLEGQAMPPPVALDDLPSVLDGSPSRSRNRLESMKLNLSERKTREDNGPTERRRLNDDRRPGARRSREHW